MLVNATRAHLAEFGIVAAQGRRKIKGLITDLDNAEVPEFARVAWLGLVPPQNSSGGKDRLSGITKAGSTYIRPLLVAGATGVIRYARGKAPGEAEWLKKLLKRKSARLASVALANKMARIAWSVLTRGEVYRNTYSVPKPI